MKPDSDDDRDPKRNGFGQKLRKLIMNVVVWVAISVSFFLFFRSESYSNFSLDLDTVASLWWPTLFALGYGVLNAGVSIALFRNGPLDDEKRPARPRQHEGISSLIFLLCVGLVFGFMHRLWSFEDIGASPGLLITAAAGALSFGLFVGIVAAVQTITGRRHRACEKAFLSMRAVWPADRRKKCFTFLAVCIVGPVLNEIVYRGFLVVALHALTNSLWLAVSVSLVLAICAEIHQGKSQLLLGALANLVSTALVLSPFGLVAAIIFAVLRNVLAFARMRTYMIAWKTRQRLSASRTREAQ